MFNLILEKSDDINALNKDGNTALNYAILSESEVATKELLARSDVDVNVKDNDNETALLWASAIWKDIPGDLFKIILEKSTDINAQDNEGWTALHWAIFCKSEIAIKELLAHKDVDVNIQNNDNYTVLQYAHKYWKDIPSYLLEKIKEKSANET